MADLKIFSDIVEDSFEKSYDYLCDTFHFGKMLGNSITLNFTLESKPIEKYVTDFRWCCLTACMNMDNE